MSEYQPVPVEAAKLIARRYDKSIVVILAYDAEHRVTHTTTYGESEKDKIYAAAGGDRCAEALGCDLQLKTTFEDFREGYDAAKLRATQEALRDLIAWCESCKCINQKPYMIGLVERMNRGCEALEDGDRFADEFGGMIVKCDDAKNNTSQEKATDGQPQT